MKHFTQRIRMLFIALAAAIAIQASTITATIGNFSYQLDTESQTATVTGGGKNLYDLVFPDKVTYQSVEFTVTKISNYAFNRYPDVRSITLPKTMTEIGIGAFAGCTSLMHIFCYAETPIALDADIAYWSAEAISDCFVHLKPGTAEAYRQADGWKDFNHIEENIDAVKIDMIDNIQYFLDGEKQTASVMKINRYYGGHFIIPDKVAYDDMEYTVTAIEHGALYYCNSIQSLTLPKGLTKIGQYALCGIGNVPIYCHAESPAEVSVNTFSETAQYYNNVLHVKPGTGDAYRNADVWKNFTNIVEDLTYTMAAVDNSVYQLSEGSQKTATLISCQDNIGDVRIPDNVSYNGEEYTVIGIGNGVFQSCRELTSIILPESITTIGNMAFCWCTGLTSVTLPENLTSIGSMAFYLCSGLTEITLPQSLTNIGDEAFCFCRGLTNVTLSEGLTTIGKSMFSSCEGLTELTLPQSLTSIGDMAFGWCTGLTNVTLPEGLTTIGSRAFYLTGLTEITIPENVNSIGGGAFGYCTGMTDITVSPQNTYYTSVNGILFSADHRELITYPAGKEQTEYTVPEEVVNIAEYAIAGCTALTDITLPQGITAIENGTFGWCTGLTHITLPQGITSIGEYAFCGCSGLTEITLPQNITSIGNWTFSYCTELAEITLPQGITSIGEYTFYECSSLTKVTLPQSITSIGYYAFYNCSSLTKITLPQGITSISSYAFSGCGELVDIYCYIDNPDQVAFPTYWGDPVPWDADTYANCTLHVKPGKKSIYQRTAIWSNFTNIVEDLETGIQEAKANDDSRIVLDGNGLTLGGSAWTVSTIDGRAVAQGNSRQTLCLPTGIYVVRCGNTVKKFYIK